MGENNINVNIEAAKYADSIYVKYSLPVEWEHQLKEIIAEAFTVGYNLRFLEDKYAQKPIDENVEEKIQEEKNKYLVAYKIPFWPESVHPNDIYTRVVEIPKPVNFQTIKKAVEDTGEKVAYVISWSKIEE